MCAQNRLDGVIQKGKLYMIPENAPKPIDARTLKCEEDFLEEYDLCLSEGINFDTCAESVCKSAIPCEAPRSVAINL